MLEALQKSCGVAPLPVAEIEGRVIEPAHPLDEIAVLELAAGSMDTRKATGINKQVKISCGEILFEKTGPPGKSAIACGLSATWGKVANQVIGIIDIQARSFTLLRKGAGCEGEQDRKERRAVQIRSGGDA